VYVRRERDPRKRHQIERESFEILNLFNISLNLLQLYQVQKKKPEVQAGSL
jgi:hypothetical protein